MTDREPLTTDRRPVLSLGETLIDLIASDGATSLDAVSSFVVRPGGAPANAAVALSRLGVPAAFCGVVGDDPFGRKLRSVLTSHGVDVSRLRATSDADTTIAFAWKDGRGDGRFRLLSMADRLLAVDDAQRAGIAGCAAIVIGSVSLAAEPSRAALYRAAELAADANVPVCFDVNVRPSLWTDPETARAACEPIFQRASLIKVSLDDVRFLFGDEVDAGRAFTLLAAYPATHLVLTDGGRGAWYVSDDGVNAGSVHHLPAFEVDALEPTGAGDAFTAATIAQLIRREWAALTEADITFASAAGALTTTRRGAMEALPSRREIEDFLASSAGR